MAYDRIVPQKGGGVQEGPQLWAQCYKAYIVAQGGGGPDPLPPWSAHVYVTGEGWVAWGGVEGSCFMPVEWDPRRAIAQTLAREQGPQPSPIQGHRRPYNGTYSSVIKGLQHAISDTFPLV